MNALLLTLLLHAEPLANGALVSVEMKVGTVTVEVQGRLVPCTHDKKCAQLPNGHRVQGRLENDRFVVEESR